MKYILTYLFLFCIVFNVLSEQDSISSPQLVFSPAGGIYVAGTTVELSVENADNARIYYTLDGSMPSSGAQHYTKPFNIKGVAVIRAVAYVNGKRLESVTHSYFCEREYTLPVISIATKPENLWDYSTGIYVKGCCADTAEPYMGANFWKDWEKWSNVEMYESDGTLCFNQAAGINIFGGFSRMLPQKSIAVFARSRYGKKRFEYTIFPERDEDKYKSFILRNSGGDFRRTHFRDAFMTQLAKPTGVAIQEYRPAVVYLNGEYWGIQNIREKINEHYLKSNYGVDKDNVDILRHNGVARHGTSRNYKKLLAYLRTHNLENDEYVEELRTFMDVDDFIRYNIAETYSDNRDAGGNIRYWRERNDSAKWRWIFYDLDLGLGNNEPKGYMRNTVRKFTSPNAEAWPDPAWSTFIIRCLLQNKNLEHQYINTFADHLNTVYKPETALALIDEMQEVLEPEMQHHLKRWKQSNENWQYHIDIVRKFVTLRPTYCRQHIMEKFGLKDTVNVDVIYPGKEICKMNFNSLKIKEDFSGVYFSGVPITVFVDPKHDYDFKGWKGRNETTMTLTVVPDKDLVLEPIFEPKPLSEQKDSIIFNELCVFQVKGDTSHDWIEFYNRSSSPVSLKGWTFTEKGYKDGFQILDEVTIQPNGYVVLVEEKAKYASNYNVDPVAVFGDFGFGLSKENGHLKLYDNAGFIVDSLSYMFDIWDTTASFSLVHPDSLSHTSRSWQLETPNPGRMSDAYKNSLKHEADKRYWTKIYYLGGGGFFFILVVGILLRRYFKKRKNRGSA
ncbi:MAG: CotH kinase family protein [Crocinitomicaceae bacterium]